MDQNHYEIGDETTGFCHECNKVTKKLARLERLHELDTETIDAMGRVINDMEAQRDRYRDMLVRLGVLKDHGR